MQELVIKLLKIKRTGKYKIGGRINLGTASSVMAGSQRTSFKADQLVSRSISILNSTKVNTER